jgi:hypothetical protein
VCPLSRPDKLNFTPHYYPAINTMPFYHPHPGGYRQAFQDLDLDRRRREYNTQIARFTGRRKNPDNAALQLGQTIITVLNDDDDIYLRPAGPVKPAVL